MHEHEEGKTMILDLEMPTEEDIRQAIEYFRRQAGTETTKNKPGRLWDAEDWYWWDVEQKLFKQANDLVRRDRYR